MSRRQFIKLNSVNVKEKLILLINNISGSSQLCSNIIFWTQVLLRYELRVLREGFLRLDGLYRDRW